MRRAYARYARPYELYFRELYPTSFKVMITLRHGMLYGKQTPANGGEYCDYIITGYKE